MVHRAQFNVARARLVTASRKDFVSGKIQIPGIQEAQRGVLSYTACFINNCTCWQAQKEYTPEIADSELSYLFI